MKAKYKTKQKQVMSMIIATMLVLTFLGFTMSREAFAISEYGTVNGYTITASLNMGSTSASASTSSGMVGSHTVNVTLGYYSKISGVADWRTAYAVNGNSTSVSATATAIGTAIETHEATSHHYASQGTAYWGTTLSIDND